MDKEEFFKALTDLEGVLDSLGSQDEAEPEEDEEEAPEKE